MRWAKKLVIDFRGCVGDGDLAQVDAAERTESALGEVPVEDAVRPFARVTDHLALGLAPVDHDERGVARPEARDDLAVRLPVGQADPAAVEGGNGGGGGAGEDDVVGGVHVGSIRVRGANVWGGRGNF